MCQFTFTITKQQQQKQQNSAPSLVSRRFRLHVNTLQPSVHQVAGRLGRHERPRAETVNRNSGRCVTQCLLHTGWRSCDHPDAEPLTHPGWRFISGDNGKKGAWAAISSLALCVGLLAAAALS